MVNRMGGVLLAVALFVSVGLAKDKPKKGPDDIGNSEPGKGVNFYSMEREIALGRQMALEVQRESRPVYDSGIGEYVNRLGQNLVRNSDAKVPFTIKVLDSDEVNAFALPGGFLFVNTGLILKAESEAEARFCLGLLSGRRHRVHCAVTLIDADGTARHRLSSSIVTFKRLSAPEVAAYLETDEWRGKAGGYAIQGLAGTFVVKLVGSYSNVVGLPLYETMSLLGGERYPLHFGWLNAV